MRGIVQMAKKESGQHGVPRALHHEAIDERRLNCSVIAQQHVGVRRVVTSREGHRLLTIAGCGCKLPVSIMREPYPGGMCR